MKHETSHVEDEFSIKTFGDFCFEIVSSFAKSISPDVNDVKPEWIPWVDPTSPKNGDRTRPTGPSAAAFKLSLGFLQSLIGFSQRFLLRICQVQIHHFCRTQKPKFSRKPHEFITNWDSTSSGWLLVKHSRDGRSKLLRQQMQKDLATTVQLVIINSSCINYTYIYIS